VSTNRSTTWSQLARQWAHVPAEYGLLFVLLLLCLTFSVLTYNDQRPASRPAARQVAAEILKKFGSDAHVLIVAGDHAQDAAFAPLVKELLTGAGISAVEVVEGEPRTARRTLARIDKGGERLDVIAASPTAARWKLLTELPTIFPTLHARVVSAPTYGWPVFLKVDNLRNIATQIAVIAILAIGMTMVIITGGIDLSVGSLVALSAVVSTLLIEKAAGALDAPAGGMFLACLAGIAVCGLVGLFNGAMITAFRVPPFIVTLSVMLVAHGLASKLSGGENVFKVPPSFMWLANGADLLSIPNAVLLMFLLYVLAIVLMTRTVLGRYLYAVGGNAKAARLSGVPVRSVLLFAYVASGLLAGLGGVVMASQLKSGSPNYGLMYELYVIAAVVVGGTSLSGGKGKMTGTLIGAFLIAVMQNGMNLTNVDPYTQQIVLGLVVLGAVLFDRLRRGWRVRED
jgi:ribose transport system permease protein